MISDQAPVYSWSTALMRPWHRNLGPQPWPCPGHPMHPANSLALSSNPHCCPCPRVREWRKALGWSSDPQEPAGIWEGGLGHSTILLCLLPAQSLHFSSVLGHVTALELPACPKWSCHVKKNTWLTAHDNSGIACVRALINTDAPNFMKGISLKGVQLFSIQTCFLIHNIIPYQAGTLYSQSCQTH